MADDPAQLEHETWVAKIVYETRETIKHSREFLEQTKLLPNQSYWPVDRRRKQHSHFGSKARL